MYKKSFPRFHWYGGAILTTPKHHHWIYRYGKI